MGFFLIYIFLIIYEIIICQNCIDGQNFCRMCNPITKLCAECYNKDVLKPDKKGGCEGIKQCKKGKNYCSECDEDEILCSECENGYLPDENGGCTYAINCEVSSEGICVKCKTDYLLIGKHSYNNIYENIKICKYNNSEEFKNCFYVNTEKGSCDYCEEGYFLTGKDRKCVKTQFCAEAKYGVCQVCIAGYYYDKSQDKCIQLNSSFYNCKMTLDGETCETCNDNYYFDENGKCISNNYCLKENDYHCEKCADGYFLTDGHECTKDKNCKIGKKDLGICALCKDNYYLDFQDGKCKPNTEDDDFKYCKFADDDVCTQCIEGYILSKDFKCTDTNYCAEVENGKCLTCDDSFHLGLDGQCNNVEGCIYVNIQGECDECEGDFYFDTNNRTCKAAKGKFAGCKNGVEELNCYNCKNDYYLNVSDQLCYSSLDNDQFYKCAKTDYWGEICSACINGYYLGSKDNKCSKIESCEISENEDKCLKCEDYFYCLDQKTGKCEKNYDIEKEEQKIYYKCNMTNKEGTKCKECINDGDEEYVINDEGICVDEKHCVKKKDGVCQQCINENYEYYCLNDVFGCLKSTYDNCLECNDMLELHKCTKCHKGYELNKYNVCIEIKD